jgi:hypothetical protein
MKSRTTYVLLVLAILVGVFVWWDARKGTTTEDVEASRKRLLDLRFADVTRVELVRSNQVIVLEKAGDRWEIKQPIVTRASGSAVGSLLSDLEFAERNRTLTEKQLKGVGLADFGLDAPRLRAKLQTKKSLVTVLVGHETPTKEAVYVQVEGQRSVAVTSKSFADRIETKLDDLRDRAVIDFSPVNVTRFEVKGERSVELIRTTTTNAEPRWAINRPIAARADQRKVSDLFGELSLLRVADFVSEDPKDDHACQLDEPIREITVWTGDSGKTLLIGKPLTNDAAKVYAKLKGADSIFTISAGSAKKFAVQANDLRDVRVLTFTESDVRGLELLHGADKIQLARDTNNVWKFTAPVPLDADDGRVAALLSKLNALTATQFVADVATDLDKFGLAAPTATVTLRGAGTNVLAQMLIGSLDATNAVRHVKRADEPFIYGVDTSIIRWLPASGLALRTRRVAELKPEQITKLVIEKISTATNQPPRSIVIERGEDNNWKMVEPTQGVLDLDGVRNLLDSLSQLRAGEFIRQGFDNLVEYGLDKPELKIAVTADGKPYMLQFGRTRDGGDQYASWSDPALVFTVAGNSFGNFQKNLVAAPLPRPVDTPSIQPRTELGQPSAPVTVTNPPSPVPVMPPDP